MYPRYHSWTIGKLSNYGYKSGMSAHDRGRARMTASLGNHRRIEIIRLLRRNPLQCVDEIADSCKIDKSTASEHLRRLHEGGMIEKKSKGRRVLLTEPNVPLPCCARSTFYGMLQPSNCWTIGKLSNSKAGAFSLG